ncbi:MAG TPA: hypothetical protein VI999_01510 [Thermoplasmata archaeon]|nr:hypothetical protein [Thermoplasmata archaeon]
MRIGGCEFPDDLLYGLEENVWARRDLDGIVLGITSAHAFLAGRLTTVAFKPVGAVLERGKSVATIESPRFFGAVRTPFAGRLVDVNRELVDRPSLGSKHPYSRGWFAKLQPLEGDPLDRLVRPEAARSGFRDLIAQLRIRCFSVLPDHEVSGIGGECPETLAALDELMQAGDDETVVHLVTDNPAADRDVPQWIATRRYAMLETRREGTLLHVLVGKRPLEAAAEGLQDPSRAHRTGFDART